MSPAPGFEGVDEHQPEFWAPLVMASLLETQSRSPGSPYGPSLDRSGATEREAISVVARFRPGVSPAVGGAAVEQWLRRTTTDRAAAERIVGVEITSKATVQRLSPEVFRAIAPILVALGLVLLAACANVASAMVARGAARQRELAVRLALGAGRGRLVRQLLTENVLLAVPAAVSGLLVSRLLLLAASRFMAVTMPDSFQSLVHLAPLDPDYRVLSFAAAVALSCAALFGLLPAFQSTRSEIVRTARDDIGLGPGKLRQALVIGQITVAALLLVSAGVLLRSAQRTQAKDLGLKTAGVVALNLDDRFRVPVIERLSRAASVRSIAAASQLPIEGVLPRISVLAEDSTAVRVALLSVSAEFFEAFSLDVLSGRAFVDAEGQTDAPVAIVNQALAQALWRGATALDRSLRIESDFAGAGLRPMSPGRSVRVVGVVQRTR